MKSLSLFLVACVPMFNSFAQWEQMANPIFTKDHGIGFSLDGYGYVLTGGRNGEVFTGTKDFFKYDPNLNAWEQLSDYPGPERGYGIGDTYNGKLYFGFGLDINGNYLDDLWEWDPLTNVFTELPSCPCDGRVHPGLIADNGKVYMGSGGNDLGNLNDWWIYDINTQIWTQKSNMPGTRHHPYQFSIDGEVYVGNGHQSSWNKYDEINDEWISVASLSRRVAGAQFSYNGKGYSLSGANNNHDVFPTGEFWEYDPVVDTWTELCSHPGTSRFAPTQFVIDNYIYLLAGYYRYNGFLFPEETMYRFNLDKTFEEVDNTISIAGNTLTANQADAEYQWIDCDNNAPINGATEQSYLASESGNYSVKVTLIDGNCTFAKTSDCLSLGFVSTLETTDIGLSIYPNPNNGSFEINLNKNIHNQLHLIDITGKLVQDLSLKGSQKEIQVDGVERGVYFLKADNQTYRVLVTK